MRQGRGGKQRQVTKTQEEDEEDEGKMKGGFEGTTVSSFTPSLSSCTHTHTHSQQTLCVCVYYLCASCATGRRRWRKRSNRGGGGDTLTKGYKHKMRIQEECPLSQHTTKTGNFCSEREGERRGKKRRRKGRESFLFFIF